MNVTEALQQARSRNAEQKALAIAALGAAAACVRTDEVQPAPGDAQHGDIEALQAMDARDRALLHKIAHDASKRELWGDAAAALAVAVCGALMPSSAASERDAATQLLRKHSYSLGFQNRSTMQLAPAVPLLLDVLTNCGASVLSRREAAGSLMNLAWKSQEHANAMVSGGAFRLLVSVLNSDSAASDAALLDNAAGAVLNILSHGSVGAACEAVASGVVDATTARLLSVGKNKWSRFGAKILDCIARPAAEVALRKTSSSMSTNLSALAQSHPSALATIATAFAGSVGEVFKLLAQLCASEGTARDTRCCALRALGCVCSAGGEAAERDDVAMLGTSDPPLLQTLVGILGPGNTKASAELRLAATECVAGVSCNRVVVDWFKSHGLVGSVAQALSAQLVMEATLGIGAHPCTKPLVFFQFHSRDVK